MIQNQSPAWSVRKLKPDYLLVARLWLQGLNHTEIAGVTGYTPVHVGRIVASPYFQDILKEISEHTISTAFDVRADAQVVAPAVFNEKVRLALGANDERVRNIACTDVLNMAGHMPVRRVEFDNVTKREDEYVGKTEEEIRAMIIGETPETTVH